MTADTQGEEADAEERKRVSGFRHRGDRLISKKLELLVDSLVLRVIHTIHRAMTHHRSYQIRYTGESRCPRQKWIPAFAGKARRGRRAPSTE
jgi:hypothetical protein